ncbi:MAG TPA: response regulator transcription factor, partial [Acidimicrobiales bacterium]|nr:response regulator transcription factor [Acidimicrobiales bacterium]
MSDASPTVLIVEDEESFVDALIVGLKREGFLVHVARDGIGALAMFDAVKPDLVLLDVMLPSLSGVDVCREIRQRSRTPIIMVTAKSSEIDTVVGLEVGADDYVTKPFSLRELQARIRAHLRRRESTDRPADQATLIRVGRTDVDLAGHRLLRDGEVRPVKPKAFDLLAFLVANAGRVFTREQLLAEVWGYEYAGETRTV